MKKISRIIISTLFAIAGMSTIFFSGSALLRGVDWLTTVILISVLAIGMAFIAVAWAIASGENVKDMLRDLFSGMSF